MDKISKIVALVLGLIGVVLCGGVLFSGVDPWADWLFIVSYVLLAIAVVSVVVFGLMNIVTSPAKLKKTLIYTGAFAFIIVISYVLASGETTTEKWVGAGIVAFYIFGAIATGLMIFSGVKNALSK